MSYHKVVSRSTAQLVAHPRIFRLLMNGEIRCVCTVTFDQTDNNKYISYLIFFVQKMNNSAIVGAAMEGASHEELSSVSVKL